MTRRNTLKYMLPVALVLLLALCAAWAFRLPPASALIERGGAPVADSAQPVEQLARYPYDVIHVSGYGRVVKTPDQATISLQVSALDNTVAEARNTMAVTTQDVVTALGNIGIVKTDMKTSHFSIYEEYDWSDGERRFLGYRVSNGLTVTVRNIDTVGAAIDGAIVAGGDHIRFDGLSFSFSDAVKASMEREARRLAVQNMQSKASQLAEFSGRTLGLVREISETDYGVGAVAESFARGFAAPAAASFDAPTPVLAGESEIAVYITGVYELR